MAGFTLIEVLVALVIVGLALAVAAGVFSTGLLGHRIAADADAALAVAEEHIALPGAAEPLRAGSSQGLFGGQFHWQTVIVPYEDKDDAGFAQQLQPTLPLFLIEVTVDWRDGLRRRQVTLSTLRLGPPAPP